MFIEIFFTKNITKYTQADIHISLQALDLKMVFDWNKNVIMSDALKQLCNNEFLSDIHFEFPNGQILYAHTFVLCMRSSKMYEIFKSKIGRISTIPIVDKTYYCMKQFLKYIYTDVCDISAETATDLFQMAQKFDIDKLEQECCDKIISTTNPCQLLEICIVNGTDLQIAIYYISENFQTTLKHVSFADISEKALCYILKLDAVSEPNEFMVFQSVMNWASRQCEKSGCPTTGLMKREKLGANLKLIRFAAMSYEEFEACVECEPDLLAGNEIIAISSKIIKKNSNLLGFSDKKRIKITYKNSEECRELNRVIFEKSHISKENNVAEEKNLVNRNCSVLPFSVYLGLKASYNRKTIQENLFSMEFSVSKSIELTGIYLNNSEKIIQCKIGNSTNELIYFECRTGNRVSFAPIKLQEHVHYTIMYKFFNYDDSIQHLDCVFIPPWNVIVPHDVKFTFYQNSPHIEWLFYNYLLSPSENTGSISLTPIKSKCLFNTIMSSNLDDSKSVLFNMLTSSDSIVIDSINNVNLNIGYNVPSSIFVRFHDLVVQTITTNNTFRVTFSVSHAIHLTAINFYGITEPIRITIIEENNGNWNVPCLNNIDSSGKLCLTPTKLQPNKQYSIFGMFCNGGVNRLEVNTLMTRNILSDDGVQFTVYRTCAYIDRLFFRIY